MNSVSMPSRPAARAWAASSATTPSVIRGIYGFAAVHLPMGIRTRPPGWRRLFAGPIAVLVEEGARTVLLVAFAAARDADPVEQVQQPHRQAGGDEQRAALEAVLAEPGGHGHDQAGDDDRD